MSNLNALTVMAPAKINLYLHVTGLRNDGYHLIDSLVTFPDIYDKVTLKVAEKLSIKVVGRFANQLPIATENLVIKAAKGLADICGKKAFAHIELNKSLPIAAGIGGGSSDAAAVLRGLKQLWKVQPSDQDFQTLAEKLGADVPICLNAKTAFMSGTGEKISQIDTFPTCAIVLANPGVPIFTSNVFNAWAKSKTGFSKPGRFKHIPPNITDLVEVLKKRENDLFSSALELCPAIGKVINALNTCEGALLTRMSGSGATCFALFKNSNEADAAANDLSREYPSWWINSGSLG